MNCGVKLSVRFQVLQRSPTYLEYDKPCIQGKNFSVTEFCIKSVRVGRTGNRGAATWTSAKQCTSGYLSEGLREENVKFKIKTEVYFIEKINTFLCDSKIYLHMCVCR